jgi:hypothetical protein
LSTGIRNIGGEGGAYFTIIQFNSPKSRRIGWSIGIEVERLCRALIEKEKEQDKQGIPHKNGKNG